LSQLERGAATDILGEEASNAANNPEVHRAVPNVSNSEVEKSFDNT
jgi:hypothetical protein